MPNNRDGSSRPPGAPSNEGTPSPARDDVPGGDAGQVKDGAAATARRVRAAVPPERSGPIGISSGDFSTPAVRKRTITQPRGIPVLGSTQPPRPPPPAPVPSEPASHVNGEAAAGPSAASSHEGAVPVDLLERTRPGGGRDGAPADDGPFVAPVLSAEMITEAAALAAEAAAVRALDSGPLTPPPQLLGVVATPSPGAPRTDVDADDLPTPPPSTAEALAAPSSGLSSAVPFLDGERTPPPSVAPLASPGAPARTPPPSVTAPPTPPLVQADTPALPDEAFLEEATPTPRPAIVPVLPASGVELAPTHEPLTGSIPSPDSAVMAVTDGFAASEPDAFVSPPLATPTAETAEPLEVVEAPDDADGIEGVDLAEVSAELETTAVSGPVSEAAPPPKRVPTQKNLTPPPIPGAKVPAPEPLLPALPILPEALSPRPRRPKRSKPWFEEVFDEDYLRTLPFLKAQQTLAEVEFIADTLRLRPGAEVLDVACGYGRHAIELVQRGYNVTGLDLSLPLLIRAADEAQRRALSVNFVHADMREMAFEKQFDGAYSMLTSFGYFEEDANLRVAERIARALKPGARFLLDVVNRDYVISDLPLRVWWEGTGCVVLEEVDFNFHTSRINTHRSIVFDDGRQVEQELSVRAYSLHEIARLLRQAGFRIVDVSGAIATRSEFFGSASRNLLVVAEKREDDAASG